jgi:hypothetical protein
MSLSDQPRPAGMHSSPFRRQKDGTARTSSPCPSHERQCRIIYQAKYALRLSYLLSKQRLFYVSNFNTKAFHFSPAYLYHCCSLTHSLTFTHTLSLSTYLEPAASAEPGTNIMRLCLYTLSPPVELIVGNLLVK